MSKVKEGHRRYCCDIPMEWVTKIKKHNEANPETQVNIAASMKKAINEIIKKLD
jgi:hypothetical protein